VVIGHGFGLHHFRFDSLRCNIKWFFRPPRHGGPAFANYGLRRGCHGWCFPCGLGVGLFSWTVAKGLLCLTGGQHPSFRMVMAFNSTFVLMPNGGLALGFFACHP